MNRRTLAKPSGTDSIVRPGLQPGWQASAGASRDFIKMWDADTGAEVLTLRGAPQRYGDPPFNARVIFHPDGPAGGDELERVHQRLGRADTRQ